MSSRDLTYIGLALLLVCLGRHFYYRMGPEIRKKFGSQWGEPETTPHQEITGLILLAIGLVVALLLMKACPLRFA